MRAERNMHKSRSEECAVRGQDGVARSAPKVRHSKAQGIALGCGADRSSSKAQRAVTNTENPCHGPLGLRRLDIPACPRASPWAFELGRVAANAAEDRTWMIQNCCASGKKALPLLAAIVLLAGCAQQMAQQPSFRPLEPTTFFPDGQSARPIPEGTVARGQLLADDPLNTGRREAARAKDQKERGGVSRENIRPSDFVDAFPVAVDAELLRRGQERYTIYCAVCHDHAGTGRGTIVRRGYTRPPSYITDDSRGFRLRGVNVPLRDVPVGYLFEVITLGFGSMPSLASEVPPRDRWAIAAYIRALQFSQHATLADLPDSERQAIEKELKAEK